MNPSPSQILVLDIETIRSTATYDDLSDRMQKQWDKKAFNLRTRKILHRMKCTWRGQVSIRSLAKLL